MANNNNCYFNAAFTGFVAGALAGQAGGSVTATDYSTICDAAAALATEVDALIAHDALVSTAMSPTELVDTASNTIQANTKARPALLQALCFGAAFGHAARSATQATAAGGPLAAAIFASWTQGLTKLVTP